MRNETIVKLLEAGQITQEEYFNLKAAVDIALQDKEYNKHMTLKPIADKMNSEEFQANPQLGYAAMARIMQGGMDSIKYLWKATDPGLAGLVLSPAKQLLMQLVFQMEYIDDKIKVVKE